MPYYKKKLFFKKTLMSIEKQSYKKFEIIIIYDDTDLTEYYYLKKITKKNKKIKIILNKSNLGAGLSRNVGVKVTGRPMLIADVGISSTSIRRSGTLLPCSVRV